MGTIFAAAGIPVIDTLGVRGANIHSDKEYACLDSLVERAKLSALILMRIAAGDLKARVCENDRASRTQNRVGMTNDRAQGEVIRPVRLEDFDQTSRTRETIRRRHDEPANGPQCFALCVSRLRRMLL